MTDITDKDAKFLITEIVKGSSLLRMKGRKRKEHEEKADTLKRFISGYMKVPRNRGELVTAVKGNYKENDGSVANRILDDIETHISNMDEDIFDSIFDEIIRRSIISDGSINIE